MTVTATLLYNGLRMHDGLSDRRATLVYEVTGLGATQGTLPLDEAKDGVPINKGDPFPSGLGTLAANCQGKEVLRFLNPSTAWVAVYYSVSRWGSAPYNLATFNTTAKEVVVPGFSVDPPIIVGPNIYPYTYYYNKRIGWRMEVRRMISVAWGADPAIGAIDEIVPNIGKLYTFSNIPYVLEAADVLTSQNGRGRLTYRWYTRTPIKGIAATSTNIQTPDLGYFEEWDVNRGAYPPTITKVTVAQQFVQGDSLPGVDQ